VQTGGSHFCPFGPSLDEIVKGFKTVANRRGRKVLIHCSGEV